jgi:hypothetical protein
MKNTPRPEDFVLNYSPADSANLFLWEVDERPLISLRSLLRHARGRLFDVNGNEVKRALAEMTDRWGNTSSETIAQYLSEKFSADHLRKFEYAFLARCMARPDVCKSMIVDIGGGRSYSTVVPMLYSLATTQIISIDVNHHTAISKYRVRYVVGDAMHTQLSDGTVDLLINISTLEHVGLGRWGDPLDVDGDIKCMQETRRILKCGGHAVVTIPYGAPAVVYNLNRIYDVGRVQRLTEGFETVLAEYSLYGNPCARADVEGKPVTNHIPGYYESVPETRRHPEAPGGVMLLLRKVN